MSECSEVPQDEDEIKGRSSQLIMPCSPSPEHVRNYSSINEPLGTTGTLLFVADALWSCFVVFPLLVLYWSGTWFLLDIYLFPKNLMYSALASLIAGSMILFLIYYALPLLGQHISVGWTLKHVIVSRCMIYVTALGVLLYFRGIWNLVDTLAIEKLEISIIIVVSNQLALILLRASVNAAGSPLIVQMDISDDFYLLSTRCKTTIDSLLYYTLDVLLTIFVILSSVVLLWVGLWQLGDALILPNSILLSYIVCLGAGYTCTAFLFILQNPLELLLDHLTGPERGQVSRCSAACIDVVYNCLSTVVVLLLWRGLWGFIKTFVLIDNAQTLPKHVLLGWTFHAVGFVSMILLQVGRTLGSVGCAVDGEHLIRSSVVSHIDETVRTRDPLPINVGDVQSRRLAQRVQYFSLFYQNRRRINFSVNRIDNESDSRVSETSTLLNSQSPTATRDAH